MKKVIMPMVIFFILCLLTFKVDIERIGSLFNQIQSLKLGDIILIISNVTLAVITYFYLRETQQIRKIGQLSYKIESSPKVYIHDSITIFKYNEEDDHVYMNVSLQLKNVGKSEATDLSVNYRWVYNNGMYDDSRKIAPYIFPDQEMSFNLIPLKFDMDTTEINNIVKELFDTGEFDLPSTFTDRSKIQLYIQIGFKDQDCEEKMVEWSLEYNSPFNMWSYI
ncbi:hypothetical protein G9F72_018120 [Clostridium estertheticum]|uniref:hypothetical protein n=1 Tax=Clostridium estertheticum TaxID=238834 RepID=UPI0013E90DA1|nr:hypothetical protein [Clostridium estertheticum]MBZ9688254.1 hypothetical protein [Clostridium estertheticum]